MKSTKFPLGCALFIGAAAMVSLVKAADKPKTFALVPKSISVPFYADVEKGCKEEAQKLGVKVLYTGPNTADEAEQVEVLRDVISRGVSGLAVAPMNADSVIGPIADARKKNIPVITFDSDSPKSERICYVGTDNLDAGREAGKVFKKLLPKGKYAIITGGLAAANLNERIKGFKEVVSGSEYREVPGSPFPCEDDAVRAVQIVQDLMTRYPDLDGVFHSGGWALFGAPEAYVKALGKRAADIKSNKFVVVAFDTLPEELKLLKDGYCSALIGQRPYAMGVKSMDVLNDIANGGKGENVNTGVDVVDASNVDQFLK
ncbi:MAG: sugar-binding protein [Verrucomicrobia bacterium]|nr:sugar-binding protein [Verrucomicrobiota bacterium]